MNRYLKGLPRKQLSSYLNTSNTSSINHTRNVTTTTPAIMPLVVPGINSNEAKTQGMDWQMKLMGKKIGDKTDETVSIASTQYLRTSMRHWS